jgi:HEAT repeat protein
MVRIKVEELVDHLSTNSIPPLIDGIRAATDDDVARLCCYYLARFDEKARAAIPAILPLLKRDKCRTTAFYTLGHMRAAEAFRPALAALDESRELVRLRATQTLGKIGDRRAIPALLRRLDDEMYDVRYAAEDALVKFGQPSRAPLRDAYRHATPRAQPHIIEALAKLGDETALTLAREYYQNDDPLVRTAVLKSLTAALTTATAPTAK